jgi:hypothetical protein
MLHRGLVPDDEVCLTDEICQVRVLLNATGRGFMDFERNLEGGMRSPTSIEKQRSDARGSNTKNNLGLTTQMRTDSVVDKSLACATWTIEEKGLA